MGDGQLGEPEIQGMVLAVYEYMSVLPCICDKGLLISDSVFRRKNMNKYSEKKMEWESYSKNLPSYKLQSS